MYRPRDGSPLVTILRLLPDQDPWSGQCSLLNSVICRPSCGSWLAPCSVVAYRISSSWVFRSDATDARKMARDEIGPVGGFTALAAVLLIMVILIAVLGLVVVNAMKHSTWATSTVAATVPRSAAQRKSRATSAPTDVSRERISNWPEAPCLRRGHAPARGAAVTRRAVSPSAPGTPRR